MNQDGNEPRASSPPPLPRVHSPLRPPSEKKGSLTWLWILLGVMGILLIGSIVGLGVVAYKKFQEGIATAMAGLQIGNNFEVSLVGLMADRAGHVTAWQESSFEAAGEPDSPPEGVFDLISYPAPAGDLAAYLTPDPKDGQRRPAVVWAKGGFGGIGSYFWEEASPSDDQSARAFREAGLVLMCPSWRGENANPGRFESFYGEVNDLLAAIDYVKTLPYVDPERVYLGGHSTGGTMVLLAATAGAEVRATFSFGGAPDMAEVMEDGDGFGNTPYDLTNARENELRSAIRYTPFITNPVFYFEGGDSSYQDAWESMEEVAGDHGVPFEAFALPGDHFNILAPITELIAQKIKSDTGLRCGITFSDAELKSAWRSMHDLPVAATIDRWIRDGGDLQKMLDALGEEVGADDPGDTKAMVRAIQILAKKSDAQSAKDLATVVALIVPTYDEATLMNFEEHGIPLVRNWVIKQSTRGLSNEQSTEVLEVVESLLYNMDDEVATIVLKLMARDFAEGHWMWEQVFEALDPDDGMFEVILAALKKDPPGGGTGTYWLNRVNALMEDDWEGPHPYDSKAGREQLKIWLAEEVGLAHSAAYGLGFVGEETRRKLLDLALKHSDKGVQLEAAWADAKFGGSKGIHALQQACLELEWSVTAQSYLREVEQEEAIPAKAQEAAFAATAKMAAWLKHPNELAQMPESLELFDHRTLFWPPEEKKVAVWLFSFTYRFEEADPLKTGYGMVGGMTWSSFQEYEKPPTPEALYIHHCALELSRKPGLEDGEALPVTDAEARRLLQEENSGFE